LSHPIDLREENYLDILDLGLFRITQAPNVEKRRGNQEIIAKWRGARTDRGKADRSARGQSLHRPDTGIGADRIIPERAFGAGRQRQKKSDGNPGQPGKCLQENLPGDCILVKRRGSTRAPIGKCAGPIPVIPSVTEMTIDRE